MRQLLDLLQGQVERRDVVRDQTLSGKTSREIRETRQPGDGRTFHTGGTVLLRTSGGVLAGGVTREALDEALEGDGLTDSLESVSASRAPLPFIWTHTHTSA